MSGTCITPGCGIGITHQHMPDTDPIGRYIHGGYCFGCAFWQAQADQDRTDPRAFVALTGDGRLAHYVAGTAKGGNPKFRGSYGAHYRIDLNGHIIGTEDLWSQGVVPREWEHLFDRVPRGVFIHTNSQGADRL